MNNKRKSRHSIQRTHQRPSTNLSDGYDDVYMSAEDTPGFKNAEDYYDTINENEARYSAQPSYLTSTYSSPYINQNEVPSQKMNSELTAYTKLRCN